jgi:hypothetical protein
MDSLPLGPLTSDIKQLVCQLANCKVSLAANQLSCQYEGMDSLRDTSSLDSSSKDILVGRHIIRTCDPGNSIKVATRQLPCPDKRYITY